MTDALINRCILAAEVSGTDRLNEKLGETEALRAVERCLNRMDRSVTAHKGRAVKLHDDQLTAAFDTADEAYQAACDMQQRIHALPPVSGVSLAIRIGLHCGILPNDANDSLEEIIEFADYLLTAAHSGQILISANTVEALATSQHTQIKEATEFPEIKGIKVFEAIWDNELPPMELTPPAAVVHNSRMRIFHGLKEIILGPDRPTLTLGRDSHSEIITRDSRASRNHGRIEKRRDKFILIDQSTNGTFVTFDGEAELVVKHEELVLRGRGSLCFGHTGETEGIERVEFEVLD